MPKFIGIIQTDIMGFSEKCYAGETIEDVQSSMSPELSGMEWDNRHDNAGIYDLSNMKLVSYYSEYGKATWHDV